ncbi:gliding motility protein GldN [Soonwooa sp.]|uniref:type IX secretion system ring protein PorN/GldN n=1 Tax=Soonwooa sp. TaxID=1938592 RepID=UPI0035B00712
MKKIVFNFLLLSSSFALAQTSVLNATSPEKFRQEREAKKDSLAAPLKYGFIEDKDVLKSMVVWEIIDMNDKINQPFYHNNDGLVAQNKSLYQVLIDAVTSGKIAEVYSDENFTTRLTPEGIAASTSAINVDNYFVQLMNEGKIDDKNVTKTLKGYKSVMNEDDASINALKGYYSTRLQDVYKDGKDNVIVKLDGSHFKVTQNEIVANVDQIKTSTENVKLLKIMGQWYIDKRDSQLKYRLLGICAMGPDPNGAKAQASITSSQIESGVTPEAAAPDSIDLFWVFYPDARKVLSSNYIFNSKNTTSDITFDDVLNARRFSSIIYKSDNGQGRGGSGIIEDYVPDDANGQIEESDRIRARILQMENDLWNY